MSCHKIIKTGHTAKLPTEIEAPPCRLPQRDGFSKRGGSILFLSSQPCGCVRLGIVPAVKICAATARKASDTTVSECREMFSCRAMFRYTLGRMYSSSSPADRQTARGQHTPCSHRGGITAGGTLGMPPGKESEPQLHLSLGSRVLRVI